MYAEDALFGANFDAIDWEITAKAKTAEDDHTANSRITRTVPTQALLKGHKYYSHSIFT